MRWLIQLPESLQKRPLASFFQALTRVFLVVALPFFLLSGLNQYFAAEDLRERVAVERQSMAQLLATITAQASPESLLDGLFKNSAELEFPSETFYRRLGQLHAAYPEALEVYLFDARALCVNVPGMPVPPRYAAQKFLESVLDPATGAKNERFLIQLSGYRNAHVALNRSPGTIVSIGSSHDRHWGGWFKLHDRAGAVSGHMVVFVRKGTLAHDELLEKAVIEANQKFGRNYLFAWQDPINPTVLRPVSQGFSQDMVGIVNGIAIGENRFEYGGCPGIKIYTGAGVAVFAKTAYPIEEATLFVMARFFLNTVALFSILLLLPVYLGVSSFKIGLKMRLASVFLFGAGVPLILLVFTGIADRSEREKVMINEYQQKSIRELTRIDEGMAFDYRRLENVCNSFVDKSSSLSENEFAESIKSMGKFLSLFSSSLRQIIVVRKDSSISFTRQHPEGQVHGQKESMVLYGQMLLDVISGDYLEGEDKGGSADLRSVVNNFGGWLSVGLIMNSRRIGQINMLDSVVPTYVDFFLTENGIARGMTFIFLVREAVQRNYLFKVCRMRDRIGRGDAPRFAAVPVLRSPVWPAFPRRSIANNSVARGMTEQVMRSGIPVHEIARIGNQKYLLTAVKGKIIDGYVLFFAQPYSLIEKNLQMLNRRMQILTVLVVFIALLAAGITSRFLLKPLENLKTGLEAVSCGNFRTQIAGAGVAEFSSMISSLNQTLESFQELQVARNIQETLWPEEQLRGPDWHLFGRCITATELGGDHFDWIQLKDNRLLLVIGDVTGHGIAPAMVQAAIKVWLSMYAEKSASASALLHEISRLHFNYGAKRLYMTCWLGFFSPETGELDYAAAGHPYPYLLRADGSIERLVLQGMPLGIREKVRIGSDRRSIAPGESLILYTDGIIETLNRHNVMLGFDEFEKICQQTGFMSAEKSVNHILSVAAAWGPQNDDQTVIVLHREKQGEQNVSA